MVKSGAPQSNEKAAEKSAQKSATEKLTQALRAGGEDLLRFRTLTQKTPIQPLQILPAPNVDDHILATPGDKIAVIANDHGQAAVAFEALRPHWHVVNWVPDMKSLLRVQSLHPDSRVHFDKQPHQKRP